MKEELRKEYLGIRKNIIDKDKKSLSIFKKIVKDKDYINSRVIAIYKSLDNEVSTNKLIEYSLSIGKIAVVPITNKNDMNFYKIDNNTKYTKSNFGVDEPISNEIYTNIDLFIIPGVVFGRDLNRIGFGKGYYDRYLENNTGIKIGICFEEQVVDTINNSTNDIKMNKIITDKSIYYDKIK